MTADGEAEQAKTRAGHLSKQLAEHKKMLGSKEREASKLQSELKREQDTVESRRRQFVIFHFISPDPTNIRLEIMAASLLIKVSGLL